VLVDIVESEQSTRSLSDGKQIVEGRQQRHAWSPRVRIHRFKEVDVSIMDVSFATNPFDANPMNDRFLLQAFRCPFQVQITASQKIAIYLGSGGRSKASNRSLRTLPLDFLFR